MFESEAVLRQQQSQRIRDDSSGLPLTCESRLEYSSYPLTAVLRDKVSHCPPGVGTLALNCRLSLPFLYFFQSSSSDTRLVRQHLVHMIP